MYKVVSRKGMRNSTPRMFVDHASALAHYNACALGMYGDTWVGLYAQGIMQRHQRCETLAPNENDSHLSQRVNQPNEETP
jgi:hypothetical protein